MNKQLISPYIMLIFLAFMAGRHIFPNVNSGFKAIEDKAIDDKNYTSIDSDTFNLYTDNAIIFNTVIQYHPRISRDDRYGEKYRLMSKIRMMQPGDTLIFRSDIIESVTIQSEVGNINIKIEKEI